VAERIQKVLATAGVGSRRQVESWLVAGRISVNGVVATLGQRIGPRDVVSLDGRKVRLPERDESAPRLLMYHRPAGEALIAAGTADPERPATSSIERLPKLRGGRWLALSPLSPLDGGLELFTSDGALRDAVSKHAAQLTSEYSVRLRRVPTDSELARLADLAAALEDPFELLEVTPAGGEGQNVWVQLTVRGGRPRDLRRLWSAVDIDVSRILRVRFGPVAMDRALARCRHRELTDSEAAALRAEVGLCAEAARAPAKKRVSAARPAATDRRRRR
jgi:23S rRNA pseudouridine2605 synthase